MQTYADKYENIGLMLPSTFIKYVKFAGILCKINSSNWINLNAADSQGTITVTNLEPSQQYTVHLSAGNDVGFGPSIKFVIDTAPAEQSGRRVRRSRDLSITQPLTYEVSVYVSVWYW